MTTKESKTEKPAVKKKTTATKTATSKKASASTVKKVSAAKPKTTAVAKPRAAASNAAGRSGARSLVIVESPAKAKTLQKYLGKEFKIEASVGHVKDLPTSKIGVDIDQGFLPDYVILKGKEKVIAKIRKSAESADRIYLAPDPDREGEAIAWHIASELQDLGGDKQIFRATFNEITKRAVQEAIENPRQINMALFEAQQARRILDRLVGYKISPLLWTKVTRGLSAGRVQSVAVRLVVEREREIKAFIPEEYWSMEADVNGPKPPPFKMKLAQLNGAKAELGKVEAVREVFDKLVGGASVEEQMLERRRESDTERKQLQAALNGVSWQVKSVEKKDVRRHPAPPFITSTLQQEASRKLGYGAKRTMSLAQKLYEGVELGEMGHTALITYMRTDSTRISGEAIGAARSYIEKAYGDNYLPASPRVFKSKKSSQDAHECVRPTDLSLPPEMVYKYLDPDQAKLYGIIWNRFVASQMADALFEQTKVEAEPTSDILFTATGLVQKFPGYLAVYEEGRDETSNAAEDDSETRLPELNAGDSLQVKILRGLQHFTQPPPRYTEASLVKELEKRGIGRPSTYATIVSVIQDKEYVDKDDSKRFKATELGFIVTDLLVENFPEVLDVSFTAQMEERLDAVEDGQQNWQTLLGEFYGGFKERLDAAAVNMRSVKKEETPTDILCDKCGEANMVVKFGRNGRFLACPKYPDCKNTSEYTTSETGEVAQVQMEESDEDCPNCGKKMIVRNGRHGRFLACPGYPECKSVLPMKTGVKCPECSTGDLVERMSKRGKMFFSCSNYPDCKHVEWSRPMPQPCPNCDSKYLLLKEGKKRQLTCPNGDCKYKQELESVESGAGDGAEE